MKGGYIEIYRSLQEHWLWNHDKFTKGQAWIDLLMFAEFDDTEVEWKAIKIPAKRGQFVTSQVALSRRWKWNRGKVNQFLKKLVDEKMISILTDSDRVHGHTKITILNYPEPGKRPQRANTGKSLKVNNLSNTIEHSDRTQHHHTYSNQSSNHLGNKEEAQSQTDLTLFSPKESKIPLPELSKKYWNMVAKKSKFLPAYNRTISDDFTDDILKCWKNSKLKPSEFIAEIYLLAKLADRDPFCNGQKPSNSHPNFKVTFKFLIKYIGKVQDWTDYIRQNKYNALPVPTYREIIEHEERLESEKKSYNIDKQGLKEAIGSSDLPDAKVVAAFLEMPFKKADPRLATLERMKEKYTNELRFAFSKREEAQINGVIRMIIQKIKDIKSEKHH